MSKSRGNKFSKQKFEERIKNEINLIFRKDLKDPRLQFVTVTHVDLANDYSLAKVYWDSFQTEKKDEIALSLKGLVGRVKTSLARSMEVRHIPELKFFYNSQFEDELKITQLLKNDNGQE